MDPLTVEQFEAALPANMKRDINPLLVMQINNTLDNPEEWEQYKENLLTYVGVLQMGKFKMEQYVNAVRYVGFKLMGMTNKEAYMKTFPDKYADFQARGIPAKDIASYSTAYNKSKLVNLIFEQTLIPVHILNAPAFQQALNVQIELMYNAKSEMVRSNAANSVMVQVRPPEIKKMELDIGVTSTASIVDDYKNAMTMMVEKQLELIKQGGDVKQIANTPITIEAEVIE